MTLVANSSQTNRLLALVHSQGDGAVSVLFQRHERRLRKMVRLRLDPQLHGVVRSADVIEQVFVDARRRLGEYLAQPAGSFFLWLRELAGQRLTAIHHERLGDAASPVFALRKSLPPVHSESLAVQLFRERMVRPTTRLDWLQRLEEALQALAPRDRELVALCHFEELTEAELGAVLEIDPGEADAAYLQALEQLSDILHGIPGFFEAK
jgi:RNA polymerase sigma-70 factor, ECF subfamily